ncbi:MAG: FTR1 family iron permease [Solirubrobacterales bacterium]
MRFADSKWPVSGRSTATVASILAAVVAAFLLPLATNADAAQPQAPWELEAGIEEQFSNVTTSLALGDHQTPEFASPDRLVSGPPAAQLKRFAPKQYASLKEGLADARKATAAGDPVALAAAQGDSISALRFGSYKTTLALTEADRVEDAKSWLLVRDFRPSTKFSQLTVEAADALESLEEGDSSPEEAAALVDKDLLDTYQARVDIGLGAAGEAGQKRFYPRFAELTALSAGYWKIIRGRFVEDRGSKETKVTDGYFESVAEAGLTGDVPLFRNAARAIKGHLEAFVASPLTLDDKVRRAAQFDRFIELVPIEYSRGVVGDQVTRDFEVQEAIAFADGAEQSLKDLSSDLLKQDAPKTRELLANVEDLQMDLKNTSEGGVVTSPDEIEAQASEISDTADSMFPDDWKGSSEDADYDLVDISLDQMLNAINAGDYEIAEQNRLSAYAFFEFGPEVKLRGFDPGLSVEIEGMFWYGARGFDGLATEIANESSGRDVQPTLVELKSAIDDAHEITGSNTSSGTVITNAALIVFREGLEAILIIAAITASMIGARRYLRKPVYRGALLAIPASIASYALMVMLLGSFAKYGEKVEAIVGLMAIAVLLVVLNWFFHKVYWTEWIATHRRKTKEITAGLGVGAAAGGATVFGLYALGFESVFREGMETVLFLQALQLAAGTGPVLIGVGIGLAAMAVVGVLTFKLESKLPYKKMLIVTGVLIAFVLFTMVGTTVRVMQGVGWLPIHPIDAQFPLWIGNWLGIFPSWETLAAQFLAIAFVIGSYFAAGWVSKRKLAKQRAEYEASLLQDDAPEEPIAGGNGNGNSADGPQVNVNGEGVIPPNEQKSPEEVVSSGTK